MTLTEGTYRVVDAATGKVRGKAYKTESGARSYAEHVTVCLGRLFLVAKVVTK